MARKPNARVKHNRKAIAHPVSGIGGVDPVPVPLTGDREKLWTNLRAQYRLEPASEQLLLNACQSLERASQLAEQVSDQGMTFTDRFGAIRVNPAAQLERDFRGLAARQLQQLAARMEGD